MNFKVYRVIFSNGHPMPITLEDISDESEYTIDDRKYYSQTFKIKLKAYIIRSEDFDVKNIFAIKIHYAFVIDVSVSNTNWWYY